MSEALGKILTHPQFSGVLRHAVLMVGTTLLTQHVANLELRAELAGVLLAFTRAWSWYDDQRVGRRAVFKAVVGGGGGGDLRETCEGCGKRATGFDVQGVPLCGACMDELRREPAAFDGAEALASAEIGPASERLTGTRVGPGDRPQGTPPPPAKA